MQIWPDEVGNCPEQYRPLTAEPSGSSEGSANRAAWRVAARFFWVAAQKALISRDFRLMRESATQAAAAEKKGSPAEALLVAIFGGDLTQPPPSNVVDIGRGISEQQSIAAKSLVEAEISRHALAEKAKQQAAQASRSAAINKDRNAAVAKKLAEVGQKLAVGVVYDATVSYKTYKATRCGDSASVCQIGDVLVECAQFGPSGTARKVRITAIRNTRPYGVKCYAVAEVVK